MGKSGWSGGWDAVRNYDLERNGGLEVLFADLTRVQKVSRGPLYQNMAWRSSHGLDVMGVGNTGFSFEET